MEGGVCEVSGDEFGGLELGLRGPFEALWAPLGFIAGDAGSGQQVVDQAACQASARP
jgi:hypothetical protein